MSGSKKLIWVGRVISALLILLFTMSAFMKFKGGAELTQGMAHLELPKSLILPLGMLEISCVVIYAIPATAVVGAILLTGYIGGAILTHLRVDDPLYMQIGIGILIWLGLYLRDNRLRDLIPLRQKYTLNP